MIKTIWKSKVPVETHPHDERSSGHRVPVKLTRKMSLSIYGCANASPGARFLHLHSPTAFPAAERWENTGGDLLVGSRFGSLSHASKAMHTLVLLAAAASNAFPRKPPVSTGNCPPAGFSTEGINPNE